MVEWPYDSMPWMELFNDEGGFGLLAIKNGYLLVQKAGDTSRT